MQLCRGRGLGAGQASGQLAGSEQLLGKNISVPRALRGRREGKHLAGLPATPSQPGQTSWLWGGKSWEGPNPAPGTGTGGLAAVSPEQNPALYGEKANSWPEPNPKRAPSLPYRAGGSQPGPGQHGCPRCHQLPLSCAAKELVTLWHDRHRARSGARRGATRG